MLVTAANEPARNMSIDLRPKQFHEMIGQSSLVTQLKSTFSKRVPTGVMLIGEPGAGKTTIARIISIALQCDHAKEFGEPCEECMAEADSYEIIERNAAQLSTAEDARNLIPVLAYRPQAGKYRCIILDEAQQMTPAAQNIMLKPVEDETGYNVFFFCTTNPEKIIPAIKSRCVTFTVKGLDKKGIAELIEMAVDKVASDRQLTEFVPLVEELEGAKVTSPRAVLQALEKFLAGVPVQEAILVQESGTIDFNALNRAVVAGNWNECRQLLVNAQPADGQTIRMRLSGYLRIFLLKSQGSTAQVLSSAIIELCDHAVYETGMQLSGACASIYRICQMVEMAKEAKRKENRSE